MQVQRITIEPADAVGALPSSGYAGAFELSHPVTGDRSPEQWARAVWEQAPALVRRLLLGGWRIGLGLRLGPRDTPAQVLGWTLTSATGQVAVLDARSRLLTARNVVELRGARVRWTTFVRFDTRPARVLWSLAVPVHHVMMSYLLRRAAEQEQG
ncbi:hypothetical protein [Amycolatopsis sp. NPDC059021]|uniref:hypothetical protein n=1 Tax=Amycolatopsis sp. NPDC059021 TaxID=3346704 RepID=UPI00366E5726